MKKGNSMLGFLQRNLRINNKDTKASAYFSIVRPNLEYCASIWNPHTAQAKHKIEMVQRRAARYTTNRYRNTSSVTDMLKELSWDTLELREKEPNSLSSTRSSTTLWTYQLMTIWHLHLQGPGQHTRSNLDITRQLVTTLSSIFHIHSHYGTHYQLQ